MRKIFSYGSSFSVDCDLRHREWKKASLLHMHVLGNHLHQVSWNHRRKPAGWRNAFQWPGLTRTNLWHAVKWWEAPLEPQDSWISFIAGLSGHRHESFQAGLLAQCGRYTAGTKSVFSVSLCEMTVWLKSMWAAETVQFAIRWFLWYRYTGWKQRLFPTGYCTSF